MTNLIFADVSGPLAAAGVMCVAVVVLVVFNLKKVPELVRGVREGFHDWWDGD